MFTASLIRHPPGNGIQNHDTLFVVFCFTFGQHKHADTEFWHLHFPFPTKLGDLACSAASVQRKQNMLLQVGWTLRQQPLFLVFTIEDYRETQYLHKDHLGSLDVITDATGALVQELSFDAWGQRRNATDWSALTSLQLTGFDHSRTTRGFTGHEMLDEVGVIHMNGRIYDPKLGRFLQADPFVQDPLNTQSLNRYSYVWNNPLNATDPSGYFVSLIVGAIIAAKGVTDIAVVAAWMAAAAATETIIAGGNFADAFLSGLSAAAFAGIGAQFQGAFELGWASAGEVIAFGAVGGITTAMQGGKFGHGFRSAGLGAILGGAISDQADLGKKLGATGRNIAKVVVGGTLSEISGGKFANGAAYSAFSVAAQALASDEVRSPTGGGNKEENQKDEIYSKSGPGLFSKALNVVGDVAGKIWNLPNTAIGAVLGGVGHVTGEIGQAFGFWSREPTISFGNNAIQFENIPFGNGALTLGNTIIYGGGLSPSDVGHWYGDSRVLNLGRHEMGHTYQSQAFGPFYIPAYLLRGGISASNPFERGANNYSNGGDWWP